MPAFMFNAATPTISFQKSHSQLLLDVTNRWLKRKMWTKRAYKLSKQHFDPKQLLTLFFRMQPTAIIVILITHASIIQDKNQQSILTYVNFTINHPSIIKMIVFHCCLPSATWQKKKKAMAVSLHSSVGFRSAFRRNSNFVWPDYSALAVGGRVLRLRDRQCLTGGFRVRCGVEEGKSERNGNELCSWFLLVHGLLGCGDEERKYGNPNLLWCSNCRWGSSGVVVR